jgi:hypothetical protein
MEKLRNRLATILAVALIAFGIGATQAIAQPAVIGNFTLPFEVRWNNVALPAGDYTFDLKSTANGSAMILEGPNGRIFVRGMVVENQKSGSECTACGSHRRPALCEGPVLGRFRHAHFLLGTQAAQGRIAGQGRDDRRHSRLDRALSDIPVTMGTGEASWPRPFFCAEVFPPDSAPRASDRLP